MKVDPPPPPADADVNTDDIDSSQDTDNDEPSAFAQVLAKKREDREEQDSAQAKGRKQSEGPPDAGAAAALVQPQLAPEPSPQAAPVESKRLAGVPIALQELVREISVATNAAGNQQVHIELNSNVLKGLHVIVERKEGAVAIQFQSASDEVARLLSRNADALSQGLSDRGVSVANIRVYGPGESARSQNDKARFAAGASRPRGGQGGKQ